MFIGFKQIRQLIRLSSRIKRNLDQNLYGALLMPFIYLLLVSVALYRETLSDHIVRTKIAIYYVLLLLCPFFLFFNIVWHDNRRHPECPCALWKRSHFERLADWLHSQLCLNCPFLFGNRMKIHSSIPAETLFEIFRFIPSENAPRLWTTSALFASHFIAFHDKLEMQFHRCPANPAPAAAPLLSEAERERDELRAEKDEWTNERRALLERIERLEQQLAAATAATGVVPRPAAQQPAVVPVPNEPPIVPADVAVLPGWQNIFQLLEHFFNFVGAIWRWVLRIGLIALVLMQLYGRHIHLATAASLFPPSTDNNSTFVQHPV